MTPWRHDAMSSWRHQHQFLSLVVDKIQRLTFFVSMVFRVRKLNATQVNTVTLTRDLVRQGYVTLNDTFPISGCRHATAVNFFCFHGFSGQGTQCNISQPCNLDTWPCTSRLRDLDAWPRTSRSRDLDVQGHASRLQCWLMLHWVSWPKKPGKQKKFIAVACLQPEIGKVPFKVTWPWRTRSRVKVTVLAYVASSFLTEKPGKQKSSSI